MTQPKEIKTIADLTPDGENYIQLNMTTLTGVANNTNGND